MKLLVPILSVLACSANACTVTNDAFLNGYRGAAAHKLRSNAAFRRSTPTRTVATLHMATAPSDNANDVNSRRRELLTRDGPYFSLDRQNNKIRFGATAKLVTKLRNDNGDRDSIVEWLKDERSLAMSIWDESLTTELGNSVYRLQTMKLQFVTLQLAPAVDMKMWTGLIRNDPNLPVFALQSIDFDPNIQVLPGMAVTPESLGIELDVVGELRASDDGKSVTGKISFESGGRLPPPMRLLPDSVLNAATDTINQTIVNFAIQSFQQGAIDKYNKYLASKAAKQ